MQQVTISYKGELYHQNFPRTTSLAELRQHISVAFDPPLQCEHQRLIIKGKQLPSFENDTNITLEDLQLSGSTKIMLVATNIDDIRTVEQGKGFYSIKNIYTLHIIVILIYINYYLNIFEF